METTYFNYSSVSKQLDWVLFIVYWVLILLISREFVKFLVMKIIPRLPRGDSLNQKKISYWSILGVSAIVILLGIIAGLDRVGINTRPILTSAAIISAIVALAIQTIVKDVVAGMMLASDGHFSVGDMLTVGSHQGVVTALKLRTLVLEGKKGQKIYIPNSEVKDVVVESAKKN